MSEYDNLLSAVDKLDLTPEQKSAILSPAKAINIESGSRGSDLIEVKKALETATEQKATYKDFADAMSKYNVKAEDIKAMAAKAGIERTYEDEISELGKILKESQGKEQLATEELRVFKQEKLLGPKFQEALKNFKDKDGRSVDLKPSFLDGIKEDLFKGIKDGDNEIIIADRMNKALLQAQANQVKFLELNGLANTNNPVHRVNEGITSAQHNDVSGINPQEIQKQLQDGGGTIDAATAAIARLRAASQK